MAVEDYTDPLVQLAKQLKPKTILEIGLGYEGFSARVWLEHTNATLLSVDKGDWGKTASLLKATYPDRFEFIQGRSEDVLPSVTSQFDLVYIDGDHAYEGVKSDILHCLALVKSGGVLLLDDYGVDIGAIDVVEGRIIDGKYGVKQAVDECITWPRTYMDIEFANGGRAYVAP